MLLIGAGLLVRSFRALQAVPLGYDPENVLAVDAGPSETQYPKAEEQRAYVDELLRRLRSLPGVEAAAAVTLRPLWGTVGMDWPFTIEGQSAAEAERNPLVNFETVTPDYFRVMRIALRSGRAFEDGDREGRPGVVIVSHDAGATLLARAGPDRQAPEDPAATDGVPRPLADGRGCSRRRAVPRADRHTARPLHVVSPIGPSTASRRRAQPATRTAGTAAAVTRIVRELNPGQPAPGVIAMTDVVAAAVAIPRFAVRVLSAFAMAAVLLACLGLYGLVAGSVGRRTREIGMRVILGARPIAIVRLVLGEGLRPTVAGVVLGLAGGLAAGRIATSLLFGVAPTDPVAIVSACCLLLFVALGAMVVPARRALRLQPAETLREE